MKHFILALLLVLLVVPAVAQDVTNLGPNDWALKAWNFKSYTNFVAASDDTTGFVSVPIVGSPLLGSEVALIVVATDSVNSQLRLLGYNSEISTSTIISATNTKEVELIGNTGGTTTWLIKGAGTNLLPGCTDFKVANVFDSDSLGTTAGRTLKFYLLWKK